MFCDLHEVDQVTIRCSDLRSLMTFGLMSVVHRVKILDRCWKFESLKVPDYVAMKP